MKCKHCGQEIRLTNYKLPTEGSVYLHTGTLIQYCYNIKLDLYFKAAPK